MCIDMCADMYVGVSISMCADMYVGVSISMCADIGVRMDMWHGRLVMFVTFGHSGNEAIRSGTPQQRC